MQHNKKIYPDLDEIQNHENKGDNFRLNEVSKCLTYLETELEKREQNFNKYKRTHSLLMKTNAISGTLSVLNSGSAVGTSLTKSQQNHNKTQQMQHLPAFLLKLLLIIVNSLLRKKYEKIFSS